MKKYVSINIIYKDEIIYKYFNLLLTKKDIRNIKVIQKGKINESSLKFIDKFNLSKILFKIKKLLA